MNFELGASPPSPPKAGGRSSEARSFREATENVHALHRLAAGTFDEIVFGAHDDEPSGAGIQPPGEFEDIGAHDILRVGQGLAFQQTNKRLTGISLLITRGDAFTEGGDFGGRRKILHGREVERGEDAAVDRDQVRSELDDHRRAGRERKLLLNLGKMPVLGHAVGAHALVALGEEIVHVRLAARATHAAEGIGNYSGWFHEVTFDFNELASEIIEEMKLTTTKHPISKRLADTKFVDGDRDRIGQVITNLLSNAIKYSPHKEKIIVTTMASAKEITLCVQDFGIGIEKEQQGKVFDRFFRVGDAEDTYAGLGLGLFISSEIIKRHGGKIWVESISGKGSTFCFTLPIKHNVEIKKGTRIHLQEKEYRTKIKRKVLPGRLPTIISPGSA